MKKVFLFLLLLVLLVGVVNAVDNSENNTAHTQLQKNTNTQNTVLTCKETQQINKKDTKIKTKTATTNTKKKSTKLSINYIPNTYYTQNAKITGKLSTKDDKVLKNRPIKLNINGKTYTAKTNTKGVYTYYYKTRTSGKNNITASYVGNTYYTQAKNSRTFKVKRMPTQLIITRYTGSTYNSPATVSGEFTNVNDNPLPNTKLYVYINGVKKTTRTDENGLFEYQYTMKNVGKNKVTVQFIGTNKYVGSKDTYSNNVNPIKTLTTVTPYYSSADKKITISGYVEDDNYDPIKKAQLTVNVNGKYYKTTTDNYGYYDLSVKPTKEATNVITVSYPGNKYYKKSTDKSSVYVPKSKKVSKISLNYIYDTEIGNYAYIEGYLTDNNNNALEYVDVVLNINGKTYTTQTDYEGYYSYSYKTTKSGTNKVIAKFKGNSQFKSTSVTKSFTVNRINTYLTLIDLGNPIKGDEFNIYGDLYDDYYNNLNKTVKITINNEVFYPTAENGMYYIRYKANKVGTNKITVYYPGNNIYKSSKIVRTFNVQQSNLVFGEVIHKGSKNFIHRNCGGHILYSGNEGVCGICGAEFYGDTRIS